MAEEKKEKKKIAFYVPRRYILCVLLFSAMLTMNCMRSCLSVAIVAMSSKTKHWEGGKWVSKPAEFHWDSEKKGILLGAFFYGYLVLQISAGWLCMKFGGKQVLGFSVFIASLINTLVPVIVRFNEDLFFVARVAQGFFLGVCIPSNHYMWSKWAPSSEKAALVSFSIAGLSAGMLTSYPISGLLAQYGFAGGWPSVFYTFGFAGLCWSVLWYFLVTNSPTEHPSISKDELALMDQIDRNESKKDSVPWCKIFTSAPVYAVIIGDFTFDSLYYTLLITMPLFLRDVHKFNVATTGMVSALPWFFMAVSTPLAGVLSDKVRKRLSTGATRKLFFLGGVVAAGIFLIISGYLETSQATMTFLCISVFFFGFPFSAIMVNALDVGQRHGGIIIGLANSIAACPGFIGPAVAGIVTKNGTQEEWLEVFYGLAFVSILGGLIFLCFGSGEAPDWAKYEELHDIEEGIELRKSKESLNEKEEDKSIKDVG